MDKPDTTARLSETHSTGGELTTIWMETESGRMFDPMDAEPSYSLSDLARGCARACRYGGQISWDVDHYSILEHQVLLAEYVIANMYPGYLSAGMSVDMLPYHAKKEVRTALMHDLHEGLILDVMRPLKKRMPDYQRLEFKFARDVATRFDLIYPMAGWMKDLDNRILVDERAQALNPSANHWGSIDGLEPLGVELQFWSPRTAYRKFKELLGKLAPLQAELL